MAPSEMDQTPNTALPDNLAAELAEVQKRSAAFLEAMRQANFLPESFPKEALTGYDKLFQDLPKNTAEGIALVLKATVSEYIEIRRVQFRHAEAEGLNADGEPLPQRDERLETEFSLLFASLSTAHAEVQVMLGRSPALPPHSEAEDTTAIPDIVQEASTSGQVTAKFALGLTDGFSASLSTDRETAARFVRTLWDAVASGRLTSLLLIKGKAAAVNALKYLKEFLRKLPERIQTTMNFLKVGIDFTEAVAHQIGDLFKDITSLCADHLKRLCDTVSKAAAELGKQQKTKGEGWEPKPKWATEAGRDNYGKWADIKVKGVTQRLRWCPSGQFLMGSPEDEEERMKQEGPQTQITFSSGFWMFNTPVTQALYEAVMGTNPSRFKTPDRPVERVSFKDTQEFLQKVNDLVPDLSLSLPSEAEWEYACRAGTTAARYSEDLDAIAWYRENSSEGFDLKKGKNLRKVWSDLIGEEELKKIPDALAGTHPVAQKLANPWGLYDTLGNVFEWCADAWKDTHTDADPTGLPRTAPKMLEREDSTPRVVRGGAWRYTAQVCRAAYRNWFAPDYRNGNLGFRPTQREPASKPS